MEISALVHLPTRLFYFCLALAQSPSAVSISRCEHLFYSGFVSHGRGMHPDVRLEVRLNGAAIRLAHEDAPVREAVAQLEALAGGRADLLAAAAGSILGGYLNRPGSTHPQAVYSVALLVLAGADVDLIVEHVDRARTRSRDGYQPR